MKIFKFVFLLAMEIFLISAQGSDFNHNFRPRNPRWPGITQDNSSVPKHLRQLNEAPKSQIALHQPKQAKNAHKNHVKAKQHKQDEEFVEEVKQPPQRHLQGTAAGFPTSLAKNNVYGFDQTMADTATITKGAGNSGFILTADSVNSQATGSESSGTKSNYANTNNIASNTAGFMTPFSFNFGGFGMPSTQASNAFSFPAAPAPQAPQHTAASASPAPQATAQPMQAQVAQTPSFGYVYPGAFSNLATSFFSNGFGSSMSDPQGGASSAGGMAWPSVTSFPGTGYNTISNNQSQTKASSETGAMGAGKTVSSLSRAGAMVDSTGTLGTLNTGSFMQQKNTASNTQMYNAN